METTIKDHSELKLVLQGVEKYVALAEDSVSQVVSRWSDFNVTNWIINIRSLARKKDRTSSGLFILKFMEYWNGDYLTKQIFQEDIDEFRPKLAVILYKSPLNKILNHTEDIDESVSEEI